MIARATMAHRLGTFLLVLMLAACGGGGSSTTHTATVTNSNNGGSNGSSGNGTTSTTVCTPTNEQYSAYPSVSGSNIAPIYMDNCAVQGSLSSSNIPYVSVRLCAPGGTNCAWIDHIQIDTGSVGLRVLASAIPTATLNSLPSVTYTSGTSTGNIGECYQFVLSYFWGGERSALVGFGGVPSKTAPVPGTVTGSANVQILNDPAIPAGAPSSCSTAAGSGSAAESTALTIGANGVLGVGLYTDDTNSAAIYYSCPDLTAGDCQALSTNQVSAAQVIPNPVWALSGSSYHNGVSLFLDTAATIRSRQVLYNSYGVTLSDGTQLTNASAVAGYLTFGIPASGTGSPTSVLLADRYSQRVSANVAGVALPSLGTGSSGGANGAFIDSGSNSYFYTQIDIPTTVLPLNTCSDNSFACETPAGSSAVISKAVVLCSVGTTSSACTSSSMPSGAYSGSIGFEDADYLFSNYVYSPVYEGLAAIQETTSGSNPFQGQFDFGLPFFLGRTTWFGIYDSANPTTTPFYGL